MNLFTLSIFLASAQLFLVQPMFAKRLLPILGGTPSVWTTCMLFFQIALLAGYVYAHLVTNRWSIRSQLIIHGTLLLLPLFVFMAGPPVWSAPDANHVVQWVLSYLLVAIGLPFFLLSTNAPLVQRWYANTLAGNANKAYALYSASNLGSLCALLAYPTLIEPHFTLKQQYSLFVYCYYAFVLVMLLIIKKSWNSAKHVTSEDLVILERVAADTDKVVSGPVLAELSTQGMSSAELKSTTDSRSRPLWVQRSNWIFLSFIPSSLLLSVTTYITTNIAPSPMFWLVPLALYLITFIIAFSPWGLKSRIWLGPAQAMLLISLCIVFSCGIIEYKLQIMFPLHIATFFFTALLCHTELASERPDAKRLTEFYLCVAIGGALGGIFNALIAPTIFQTLLEYPIVLALSCLARSPINQSLLRKNWRYGSTLLCVTLASIALLFAWSENWPADWMVYRIVVILAPVALCCLAASELPLYMMFCVISILLVGANIARPQLLFQGRNTFGTLVVQMTNDGSHYLTHGNILHGVEFMSAPRPHLPIAYYHADSPIAHIFGSFKKKFRNANIAVVGLGSGTMAAYAEPGQNWTFYEINPLVVQIAEDPNLFTYLTDCKAHKTIVLGDGRQAISKANDKEYNMIAFDAFSSDAIPVHLLTKEAIHLYLSKLADGGILVFHISNRSIDLQPILRELAKDAHLTSLVEVAGQQTSSNPKHKLVSTWFVMARNEDDLSELRTHSQFVPPSQSPVVSLWTDDFSNLLETFKLK